MVRLFLGFLMLIAIGGAVAGGITYLRLHKQREFTSANVTPAFVELDGINVPITQDGAITETRTYFFVLETRDGAPENLVVQQRPKLRDIYTNYLLALASRAGPENIENLPYVKEQLQAAAQDMLGPNVVYGVLIRSMLSTAAS